jgi:hypothetical protein
MTQLHDDPTPGRFDGALAWFAKLMTPPILGLAVTAVFLSLMILTQPDWDTGPGKYLLSNYEVERAVRSRLSDPPYLTFKHLNKGCGIAVLRRSSLRQITRINFIVGNNKKVAFASDAPSEFGKLWSRFCFQSSGEDLDRSALYGKDRRE